jgi:hypothetical protein
MAFKPTPPSRIASQTSKIGMAGGRLPSRSTATSPEPQLTQGTNRSQYYTYLTSIPTAASQDTKILYNADRNWATITLTLETAGPVAVGDKQNITPVLSGKGIVLQTGVPKKLTIPKGTKLYIAATAVNRVSIELEPLPWLEQMTAALNQIMTSILNYAGGR